MKKIVLGVWLGMTCLTATAQTADPIVMRIAGKAVTRSEFEYNYNKNNTESVIDKKDLAEYVEMFINYKLKVKAAEDARLDTLSSYQKEFRTYRDQQIRPMLVTAEAEEKEVRAYYNEMLNQLGGHDLRLPAHIFLRVPQKGTAEQQARQKVRIDSIYAALQGGADFADLARNCSEDVQSAQRGGTLTWFGPGQLVPEFEKVMYELRKGETSAPFLSTVGYHIVQLQDAKPLEPYDTLRPQIQRFLESRGLRDRLAKQIVDTLALQRNVSAEQLMDEETERLSAQDNELKYLVQEYHDGLLLYEICKTKVWDPAAKDTAALERYFKKNKKRYAWDVPHFYGMVYHAREAEGIDRVKSLLKGLEEKDWTQRVRGEMNKDSVTVRMEQRLFAVGDNAFVDSLIFKINTGKAKPRKDFPYAGVSGRLLKKGPKKWTDVGNQVVSDYQMECDNKFAEELRKRYEVVTYPEVLETVNKH